jgi:hypothetical protein
MSPQRSQRPEPPFEVHCIIRSGAAQFVLAWQMAGIINFLGLKPDSWTLADDAESRHLQGFIGQAHYTVPQRHRRLCRKTWEAEGLAKAPSDEILIQLHSPNAAVRWVGHLILVANVARSYLCCASAHSGMSIARA